MSAALLKELNGSNSPPPPRETDGLRVAAGNPPTFSGVWDEGRAGKLVLPSPSFSQVANDDAVPLALYRGVRRYTGEPLKDQTKAKSLPAHSCGSAGATGISAEFCRVCFSVRSTHSPSGHLGV